MHKLKLMSLLIICSLIIASLMFFLNTEVCIASGNTLWVDDDVIYCEESDGSILKPFCAIQDAIDEANNGDTIKVLPGTYSGNIVIDKSLSFTTENRHTTFLISNAKTPYMIDITADDVSLEGFTIFDTTISSHRKSVIHVDSDADDVVITNNIIENSMFGYGIHLDGCSGAVIRNNTINYTKGINVMYSNTNSFIKNKIENCTTTPALRFISSNSNHIQDNLIGNNTQGVYATDSSDNTFKSNEILGNTGSGVLITGGNTNIFETNIIHDNGNIGIDLKSSGSKIISSIIYENGIGIKLDSSDCIVEKNAIRRCTTYGVYTTSGSSENTIFNNSFSYNLGVYHAKEDGDNHWDNGVMGNLWDDFYGPDPNCESNLEILKVSDYYYKTGGVQDRYPKGLYQQPPEISLPSPEHLESGVTRQPSLSVKVVDPEGEKVDVTFYYILNETAYIIDINQNVESGSRASVPFYSTIQGKNAVYTYVGTGYDYFCIWYAVAKDQYSQTVSSEFIFTTLQEPINNNRPNAEAGGPYSGNVGDQIFFDGSNCNDTDGNIVFYRWSFGDDSSAVNVISPVHIYQKAGTYEVTLVIIDNYGSSNTDIAEVTIGPPKLNQDPIADAGGPYSALVDNLMILDGSTSYDPDGTIVNYTWVFPDGSVAYDEKPSHIFKNPGTYACTLTVIDNNESSDTVTAQITIQNPTEESPGFELIIAIISVLFLIIFKRKNKKKNL